MWIQMITIAPSTPSVISGGVNGNCAGGLINHTHTARKFRKSREICDKPSGNSPDTVGNFSASRKFRRPRQVQIFIFIFIWRAPGHRPLQGRSFFLGYITVFLCSVRGGCCSNVTTDTFLGRSLERPTLAGHFVPSLT